MSVNKIMLSQPFAGALYAYFAEQLDPGWGQRGPEHTSNSYYIGLYGDRWKEYRDLALTFLLVFDEISLMPADSRLPDSIESLSGDLYKNDDFGLEVDWRGSYSDEIRTHVESDMQDPILSSLLAHLPEVDREKMLSDCRHELQVAEREQVPIVCGPGRRKITERILARDAKDSSLYSNVSVQAIEHYVKISALTFKEADLDTIGKVKASAGMRDYATSFVDAMSRFDDAQTVKRSLLLAMRDAVESHEVSSQISGYLDISSTVLSTIGLIPGVGTLASIASLATSGGSKMIEAKENHRKWYEFGPEVRRQLSLVQVRRAIDRELKSLE